jgi:uncharacterized protein YeaO (DUF488 family)
MGIKTKRWNDPLAADDGFRLLVTRFRPRGLRRERENWDSWAKQLGPSEPLHAAAYGKDGPPIGFEEYRERYRIEMEAHRGTIADLAEKVRRGETITLLCSTACTDPSRCHRMLLKELIEAELPKELHSPEEAQPASAIAPQYSKLKQWLE